RDRVRATLAELVNREIRSAFFRHDAEQEDQVQYYRDLLETKPGQAVLGLKRSALGCRFLIQRHERFLKLLEEEGTLYGNDRTELIRYQGARATNDCTALFESEGAYMIWLYCLTAQRPEPKEQDLRDLGNRLFMPQALADREML